MNLRSAIRAVFQRRILLLTAVVLFLAAVNGLRAQTILVPTNAVWRYLDDGSDQDECWLFPNFDDSSWAQGPAQLGYGDGDEATEVSYGPDADDKHITTFFRTGFNVPNASLITALSVRLLCDDGAVVYVNGAEVARSRIPEWPIAHTTFASQDVSGAAERTFDWFPVEPDLLVEGSNLIAVEVHQAGPESDDLSFALELTTQPVPSLPPSVLRGPYLQSGTTTNIIVRWRTDRATNSVARFGLSDGLLKWQVSDELPRTEHLLTLTNLRPDTKYFYSIGTSDTNLAGGSGHYFRTAPLHAKPTRIWAIGDFGTAQFVPYEQQVRDAYYRFTGARETDVWLMLGDNAYFVGADDEYQMAVFDVFPDLLRRTVPWATIGNHDAALGGSFPYLDIFSPPRQGEAGGLPSGVKHYYSFDYGNIHFVCLDSEVSDRTTAGPMLTWLEQDLDANTNDWLIAFWHSPPYTRGTHNSDSLHDSGGRMVDMRENALPILEQHGVDLVLCGHSHVYERSFLLDGHYGYSFSLQPTMRKDAGSGQPEDSGPYVKSGSGPNAHEGAVYIVAGSSGWLGSVGPHPAHFYSTPYLGSLVLDVDGQRLDAKFLRETGVIEDHFTILKGVAPAPFRLATVRLSNGVVTAQWKSAAGHRYQLLQSLSLEFPIWTPFGQPVVATGATTLWSVPLEGGTEKLFFRIEDLGEDLP